MKVNVVCRNHKQDRVLPRFARYLADNNKNWILSSRPIEKVDAYYLSAYFEHQLFRSNKIKKPIGAYFTHKEEQPPNNSKQKLYLSLANKLDLRVATAKMYYQELLQFGYTELINPPIELDKFTINKKPKTNKLRFGFSGFTYGNGRKGEQLAGNIVDSFNKIDFVASGRGWPCKTKMYSWSDLPEFYQSLDLYICVASVEGIPMPPLEVLACGIPVVIPKDVGLLNDLPNIPGIYRYNKNDLGSCLEAIGKYLDDKHINCDQLRDSVSHYTVDNWCQKHYVAMEKLIDKPKSKSVKLKLNKTDSDYKHNEGIYCVAFGKQAIDCFYDLEESIRQHMPDIPIALCAEKSLGKEDIFIYHDDADIGGRRAKLKAYDNSPWERTLYLDVDTVLIDQIYFYFNLLKSGWDFVICKDPHLMDTLISFQRRNNKNEYNSTVAKISTNNVLQLNGGVWAFNRNDRVKKFFGGWQTEYEKYLQRDQGALLRSLYDNPMKMIVLGNEWNTFPKYSKGVESAGLMHYPGKARRWKGLIPGRIDSKQAWEAVRQYEKR